MPTTIQTSVKFREFLELYLRSLWTFRQLPYSTAPFLAVSMVIRFSFSKVEKKNCGSKFILGSKDDRN